VKKSGFYPLFVFLKQIVPYQNFHMNEDTMNQAATSAVDPSNVDATATDQTSVATATTPATVTDEITTNQEPAVAPTEEVPVVDEAPAA